MIETIVNIVLAVHLVGVLVGLHYLYLEGLK